jgi:hypothetical protein
MPFRSITNSIHTFLIDYPVLIVAPFLLKLGTSSPVALWLAVATRATTLLLLLTDRLTGLVRVILWVNRALGVVSIAASFGFDFTRLDAWYYWVLAAAVLLTTAVFIAARALCPSRAPYESFSRSSLCDLRGTSCASASIDCRYRD